VERKPLRSDPEKVREWQRQSRVELSRSAPLESGREGMRSTELRRSAPPRSATGWGAAEAAAAERPARRPRRLKQPTEPGELTMTEALATPFRARESASVNPDGTPRLCSRCGRRRASSWHHWLPQEFLRVYMRGLAQVLGWTPVQVRRRLREWLGDEFNLSPLCGRCHGKGTDDHRELFHRGEVPELAWEFARAIDRELAAGGRRAEAELRLTWEYPQLERGCVP
jgi:hypothetical protein